MYYDFTDQPDERKWTLEQFEEMLARGESTFLELDAYQHLIDQYQEEGNYERALKVCDFAIAQHPFSVLPLLEKAQILSLLERFEEGMQLIEHAENLQPNDSDTLNTKAILYQDAGKFEKAIAVYHQNIALNDDLTDNWSQIGHLYTLLHEHQEACTAYERALRTAPKETPETTNLIFELIECYNALGYFDKAIELSNRLIDENPYNEVAWFHLGDTYFFQKEYKKALDALDYATVIDDNYESAYRLIAKIFVLKQEYKKAVDVLHHILGIEHQLQVFPRSDIYTLLAGCYYELNEPQKAISFFHKATKAEPKNHDAWFGLGLVLTNQERWYEASHFFEKAISLVENRSEYWLEKGRADYQVGNINSSLEALEKAHNLDPENIKVYLEWSEVLFKEVGETAGISLLEEALVEHPENVHLMYRLVAYLFEARQFQEAMTHLELALDLNYDQHILLYDYFPEIETQKALFQIIEQLRG